MLSCKAAKQGSQMLRIVQMEVALAYVVCRHLRLVTKIIEFM
jgi:hypothetical protein